MYETQKLIPGHEVVGTIAQLGKDVDAAEFSEGDRCVVDPGITVRA